MLGFKLIFLINAVNFINGQFTFSGDNQNGKVETEIEQSKFKLFCKFCKYGFK